MALTQISTQGIKDGTITGSDLATNVDLVDNQKLRLGTGNDLQIYHNGTNSFIDNITGIFYIRGNGTNSLRIRSKSDEESIISLPNGAVELYHDNSKKFETTANGVQVTGRIDILGTGTRIDIADNGKIILGDGNDLQIYHDGTNSFITNTTGSLKVREDNIDFQNSAGTENLAKFIANEGVELYYDNEKVFYTRGDGVQVQNVNGDGVLYVVGSEGNEAIVKLHADDGDDNADKFQIVSHADNYFAIQNFASGSFENNLKAFGNGAVELYYNNNKKLETTSSGVTVSGNVVATGNMQINDNNFFYVGNSGDLQIYHDGSNSYIKDNGVGDLFIRNGNDDAIRCRTNGAVELYYDNSKKFETTSDGVTIEGSQHRFKGDIRFDNNTNADKDIFFDESGNKLNFFDDVKATFGNSDDLQIYHDGNYSWIKDTGTGSLQLSGNRITMRNGDAASEYMFAADENGAVELYYDNSKVLETTSTGVTVTGRLKQTTGCAFRARATSDGQTVANNTATKVNFGTEVYDYGGVYNPSNSRFTAPVDGVYNFSWSVRMGTPTSTPKLDAEIRVNGNSGQNFVNCGYNQQASNNAAWIGSGDMFMSAGQYAELFVDQNTGSTATLTSNSNANSVNNHLWWTGHLIHAA